MSIAPLSFNSNGYIDVYGTVSQIMGGRNIQAPALKQAGANLGIQISGLGKLQSALSSFQSAATALTGNAFKTFTASSSNTAVMSAVTSSSAAVGSTSIQVTQLAQAQTLSSAGQASPTAAIGTGATTTLTFQFGTTTGAAFTPNATPTASVTINNTNNSLQGIATAINAAKIGVNATTTFDGTNYHLALSSANTGANQSMSIAAVGDAQLQNLLFYTPGAATTMTQTALAQNAQLTVNGVATSSASNSITGAVAGTTLNLAGVGAATLTVAPNVGQITTNVGNFVNAYNSLKATISALGNGELKGNGTLLAIQNQISKTLNSTQGAVGAGTYNSLSQLGVTTQKDGTLALNTATLQNAVNSNLTGVAQIFTNNGNGIADKLVNQTQSLVRTGGSITRQILGLNKANSVLGNMSNSLQFSLTNRTQALVNQYTGLNSMLSSMQATSQMLSGFFTLK